MKNQAETLGRPQTNLPLPFKGNGDGGGATPAERVVDGDGTGQLGLQRNSSVPTVLCPRTPTGSEARSFCSVMGETENRVCFSVHVCVRVCVSAIKHLMKKFGACQ